jgi:TrmH family RNA methyltransferase
VVEAAHSPVAIMFGSERAGLTNEELRYAHALLRIPANPAYASLNIAMAVQIVAYEILRARLELEQDGQAAAPAGADTRSAPLATPSELDRLYQHLATVLEEIDFRDRTQSGGHLMKRIRRLLQRAEPDANEVNILRGILTAVQQRRRRAGQDS